MRWLSGMCLAILISSCNGVNPDDKAAGKVEDLEGIYRLKIQPQESGDPVKEGIDALTKSVIKQGHSYQFKKDGACQVKSKIPFARDFHQCQYIIKGDTLKISGEELNLQFLIQKASNGHEQIHVKILNYNDFDGQEATFIRE